ncbi:MAG: DUF559 domain-containing protein, partial [Anaerolineae bacterium]|nr:DUF559 domain-containing protein [Anaerolineae bacterium]
VKAINEPKRIACGAPDLAILKEGLLIGHIEAKDVGSPLNEVERTPQLQRYRAALPNLILTDYLLFRWYVDGELRRSESLGAVDSGKFKPEKNGVQHVAALLGDFLVHTPQPIATPRELAERMARLTHLIREIIVAAFEIEQASDLLHGWRRAFAEVLVADLDQPEKLGEFADMFAQTLAYGLFSARVASPPDPLSNAWRGGVKFSRQEAQGLIPKTNPFLRRFFFYITGPDLEDEPYAGLVEDLVQLLAYTDIDAVLSDFGKRTRQDDPVVHFYETFLAAYDPRLREARGVYYTPAPVVSFIVRSVDALLKSRFGLPMGLADTAKVTVKNTDPGLRVQGKEKQVRRTKDVHRVLVLDPATGTATFLYTVIDFIRSQFMESGNAGLWSSYVREHLLPRLFGFELLMAPYAVAHFKLALQLAGHDLQPEQRAAWAYDFASDERIQVYLTNALEAPHTEAGLPLFTQFVADESAAADAVKQALPIMVVMGNPPYSGHSANKGAWIDGLLKGQLPNGTKVRGYYEVDGKPLGERNPKWLQDDYVKFIRFGQHRIEQTGAGILAFISNNGYLDNPTFRGMRQSLLETFSEIYILDLHGNARKKEVAPEGGPDENVFDIMQGVAIGLFVKEPGKAGPAKVYHADLWGKRENKYRQLGDLEVESVTWEVLQPQTPFYLFTPQDMGLLEEYQGGHRVPDILIQNSMGVTTGRDAFAIAFSKPELEQRLRDLSGTMPDSAIREVYALRDSSSFSLKAAREWSRESQITDPINILDYRCFDQRFMIYASSILARDRREITQHQIDRDNISLVGFRSIREFPWLHTFVAKHAIAKEYISSLDNCYTFPLYLYPPPTATTLFDTAGLSPWPPDPAHGNRVPNLSPEFVRAMEERLGAEFRPHPPAPSPILGEGEGELLRIEEPRWGEEDELAAGARRAAPELWAKLKPLARQMRHEPTPAEDLLWQRLRNRQLANTKFRRQHVIERFIVDFYAAEARLVIEVDGPIHDYTQGQDAIRQEYLESLSLRVIRFSNDQVLHHLDDVLDHIVSHLSSIRTLQDVEHSYSLVPPLQALERGLGGEVLTPAPGGEVFTPEDILHYIYAILHSPTYRARYAEFLKIDFPRIPLPSNPAQFWCLVALGRDLVAFHLLEHPRVNEVITRYPIPGDNRVEKGHPQYAAGRVFINPTQYFEGVPEEVWEFQIGGYQVCDKWLKDRRGRLLTFDDLLHYQKVVVALKETIGLMAEIDDVIPEWPIA